MFIVHLQKPEVMKLARKYNVVSRVETGKPTTEHPSVHIVLESDPDCRVTLIMLFDPRRPRQRSTVYYLHAEGILANIGLRGLLNGANISINRTLLVWKEA